MQPVFAAAKRAPKRVIYAEGEDERVLRAAQVVVDEGLARPLLLGRPEVIAQRIAEFGLRLAPGRELRHRQPARPGGLRRRRRRLLPARAGATASRARWRAPRCAAAARCSAAMLVRKGEADAMLCGTFGRYRRPPAARARRDRPARRRAHAGRDADADAARAPAVHLRHPRQPRPERRAGGRDRAARRRGGAPLRRHAERGAAVALELRQLGRAVGAEDARGAGAGARARPELAVEGEMRGDAALSKAILDQRVPRFGPGRRRPTCW